MTPEERQERLEYWKRAMHMNDDDVCIDLVYPDSKADDAIQVGLMHVRAVDNIRVSFDFDRNGWKIEQASRFCWDAGDEVCDPDWQEVAFVEAWGREVEEETPK